MTIFIALTVLSLIGIGVALWLFKNEQEEEEMEEEEQEHLSQTPLPSLTDYLRNQKTEEQPQQPKEPEEPKEKDESLSESEQKSIDKEIELSTELDELKTKYEKLDALFKEQSSELAKTNESLENECKNRKDFNKVKDILEKEIKETKDKSRGIQVELDTAQNEGEGYKKRVAQLEDKVAKREKELLEKNDKIDELVKRLQTFASPTTAATPPAPEETPAEEDFMKLQPDVIAEPAQPTTEPPAESSPEPPDEQTPPPEPEKKTIEIIDPEKDNNQPNNDNQQDQQEGKKDDA